MNEDFWNEYYRKEMLLTGPSQFATFCAANFLTGVDTLIDAGCGSGMDARYFSRFVDVLGIDKSPSAIAATTPWASLRFEVGDVTSMKFDCDAVYARWILHTLGSSAAESFLENACKTTKLLMIETRSNKDDVAPATEGHFRRPVNLKSLIRGISRRGMSVTFSGEQRGWSRYGDDDPLLIRVIAIAQRE